MWRSLMGLMAALALSTPAWAGEMDRDGAKPAKSIVTSPVVAAMSPATELDQESPTQTCCRWRWGGWGWRGGWGVGWGGGWGGGWYRPWGGWGWNVGFYRPWGWYGGWGRPWGWGGGYCW